MAQKKDHYKETKKINIIWHEETRCIFFLSCREDKVHIEGLSVVSRKRTFFQCSSLTNCCVIAELQ